MRPELLPAPLLFWFRLPIRKAFRSNARLPLQILFDDPDRIHDERDTRPTGARVVAAIPAARTYDQFVRFPGRGPRTRERAKCAVRKTRRRTIPRRDKWRRESLQTRRREGFSCRGLPSSLRLARAADECQTTSAGPRRG